MTVRRGDRVQVRTQIGWRWATVEEVKGNSVTLKSDEGAWWTTVLDALTDTSVYKIEHARKLDRVRLVRRGDHFETESLSDS